MTTKDVLQLLHGVKGKSPKWISLCPAHDDHNPSLSIKRGDDGRTLLHCHAGCSLDAITQALGLTTQDLFENDSSNRSMSSQTNRGSVPDITNGIKSTSTYQTIEQLKEAAKNHSNTKRMGCSPTFSIYTDKEKNPLLCVCRWDSPDKKRKAFSQASFDLAKQVWTFTTSTNYLKPLYRLPTITEESIVVIVEGEKCADALAGIFEGQTDLAFTTLAGGANADPRKFDLTPIIGKKIYLSPDNDPAGESYVKKFIRELLTQGQEADSIYLIDPRQYGFTHHSENDEDWGKDVADWIESRFDSPQLNEDMQQEFRSMLVKARSIELGNDFTNEESSKGEFPKENKSTVEKRTVRKRQIPFPIEIFPERFRNWIEIMCKSSSKSFDPAAYAYSLLAAMFSAVGRTRILAIEPSSRVFASGYFALIGFPASGKSKPIRDVMKFTKPFRDRLEAEYQSEYANYLEELKIWQSSKEEVGPQPQEPIRKVYYHANFTPEGLQNAIIHYPDRTLGSIDELTDLMRSYNGQKRIDGTILTMHGGGPIRRTRVKEGERGTDTSAVTIIGGCTPENFGLLFQGENAGNGLASRFLMWQVRTGEHRTSKDLRVSRNSETSVKLSRLEKEITKMFNDVFAIPMVYSSQHSISMGDTSEPSKSTETKSHYITEQEKQELIKAGVPLRFFDEEILSLGAHYSGEIPPQKVKKQITKKPPISQYMKNENEPDWDQLTVYLEDPAAYEVWEEWKANTYDPMVNSIPESYPLHWALTRLLRDVQATMLVLHVFDQAERGKAHETGEVRPETVKKAVIFANALIYEYERIYEALDSGLNKEQLKIYNYFKTKKDKYPEGLTLRDLNRAEILKGANTDRIEKILSELCTMGLVEQKTIPPSTKGGLPTKRYVLIDYKT